MGNMSSTFDSMLTGMILILVGVALVPVVFTSIGAANWTLVSGGTSYDLKWVGYISGLLFALTLVVIGIVIVRNQLKGN